VTNNQPSSGGALATIPPDIPVSLAPDAAAAWKAMGLFREWDRYLSHAQTDLRFRLGQFLHALQERKVFLEMGSQTWYEFLNEVVPDKTGLKKTVLYDALKLAGCESLTRLSPEQRVIIPLTNANAIVRLEKTTGKPVDEAVLAQAATLPTREFQQEIGASRGYSVRAWVRDRGQVEPLDKILGLLRGCSSDLLRTVADVLYDPLVRAEAGDGPDNVMMHVHSHYQHSWQEELDRRGDFVRNPDKTSHAISQPEPQYAASSDVGDSNRAAIDKLKEELGL